MWRLGDHIRAGAVGCRQQAVRRWGAMDRRAWLDARLSRLRGGQAQHRRRCDSQCELTHLHLSIPTLGRLSAATVGGVRKMVFALSGVNMALLDIIYAPCGEAQGKPLDLLGALRSFVRVAETGSFSAVARQERTSQSTVTRQISQLEDHFGVRLLHRTTRRLSLTHDGQDLMVHARHLLDSVEGMEAALGQHRSVPVGHVRFGTSVAFGLFLAPRLPVLFARNPGLTVDLVMRDGPIDMIEERLDITTHSGSPPGSKPDRAAARHLWAHHGGGPGIPGAARPAGATRGAGGP